MQKQCITEVSSGLKHMAAAFMEAFSMATAMPQKTLLKNKYLCSCDHFAIIPYFVCILQF